MNKQLKDYRDFWLDQLLAILWSQWDAVGVQGTTTPAEHSVIDPEALILLTASIARYDARLFDSVLDWMQLHERLISVARLHTLLKSESYSSGQVLSGIAHFLSAPQSAAKWKRLTESQPTSGEPNPLFFHKDGRPFPVVRGPDPHFARAGLLRDRISLRNVARVFDAERPANLLLKLRSLFGVSSRAEIVAYLWSNPFARATETATQTGYLRRTVYNALVEMNLSGYLETRERSGEALYQLAEKKWHALLGRALPWKSWGIYFGTLDCIWRKLNTPSLVEATPLTLASELTLLVNDSVMRLDRAGIATGIRRRRLDGDPEEHTKKCFNDLSRILDFAAE